MKKNFCILFLSLLSIIVTAQIEVSQETELYNGKLYYIHLIQPGNTVYSIAKAYEVTTDEVFEVNPFAQEGIKAGQYLRIPIKNQKAVIITKPIEETINITKIIEETPLPDDTIFLLTYVADNSIPVSQLTEQFKFNPTEFKGYNPQFKNKNVISKNDVLKLPVRSKDILIEYLLKKPYSQVILLVNHSVIKGETLFSIGREYGCTSGEILQFNPGLAEHLLEGQSIRVPSKDVFSLTTLTKTVPTPECVKITKKAHYQVAMLIPFHLEKLANIVIDPNPKKNANKNFRSFDYIQFYEGFLLGLDKIDLNNATIDLKIYDVAEGEEKIKTLINRGVLDVDLIIGPFAKQPLEIGRAHV